MMHATTRLHAMPDSGSGVATPRASERDVAHLGSDRRSDRYCDRAVLCIGGSFELQLGGRAGPVHSFYVTLMLFALATALWLARLHVGMAFRVVRDDAGIWRSGLAAHLHRMRRWTTPVSV